MSAGLSFREAIKEAIPEAELSLRERIRFRIAMRRCPEKLEEEIFAQGLIEEVIPAGSLLDGALGDFDWDAFLEFIKAVLPIVLQLLPLFI